MLHQMTLPGIDSATSSPGSAVGVSPPASPAGPTTASCGPAPRRASRSASRARSEAPTTSGTYGPTCFGSPVPDGPLSSWENRLRQRLAKIGSTECALTWKASATPAGRPLSRLVPLTGRIVVTVSGSSESTEAALWHTALANDATGGSGNHRKMDGSYGSLTLAREVRAVAAMWVTPTATEGNRGSLPPRPHDTGVPLTQQVAAAMWPTAAAADAHKGAQKYTPDKGMTLAPAVYHQLGSRTHGSSATTEKPGALAPEFVAWLMGFPPEWLECAPETMPRKSKSK